MVILPTITVTGNSTEKQFELSKTLSSETAFAEVLSIRLDKVELGNIASCSSGLIISTDSS